LRPAIRIFGEIKPLDNLACLTKDDTRQLACSMITASQQEEFDRGLELDFCYKVENLCRFRVNLYHEQDGIGIAVRVIPINIPTPEELGLAPEVVRLTELNNGLVLVVGPTGSGKSTTLAALINKINHTESRHIITIEDPIEFVYPDVRSVITQREVGLHTVSFASALKHCLREDPDVILVGEMRDLETISLAITAAETGHLVITTLHTSDAISTLDRIIDVFPPHQQNQIRMQLSLNLLCIISQNLLKRADTSGRIAAYEILVSTTSVRNLIRESKTHQLLSILQTSQTQGMITFDACLATLVKRKAVNVKEAEYKALNPDSFHKEMDQLAQAKQ